jgi:hypothetical protein
MWKQSKRKWIADRVAMVRDARRRQGHELSRLQEGIVEAVAACDPNHEPACQEELEAIRTALGEEGRWVSQEEWRISTWFDTRIVPATRNDAQVYEATVECDGQRLSCACPTIEAAYAYTRLYRSIIVDQFYSIGPPWADNGIYRS